MAMRLLPRVFLTVVAAAVAMSASLAAQSAAPFKAPRTPWGDPDLQGIWNGNDLQGIGMQRDESLGTRAVLNDEEMKQRIARRDALVQSDNDEFDIEQSEKFESSGAVGGPVSPPPHWLERSSW
jgi:Spy/CpxP family protein refolding chaperone